MRPSRGPTVRRPRRPPRSGKKCCGFPSEDGYQRGDLITRDQVEPLLGRLRGMGLALPDAKQVLRDVLPADGFLSSNSPVAAGRSFMRQISSFPNAYDLLDRLSRLPRGRQTIRDLIRGPDGYKMLQYMSTTQGGRQLAKMLSNSPAPATSTSRPGGSTRPKTCCVA